MKNNFKSLFFLVSTMLLFVIVFAFFQLRNLQNNIEDVSNKQIKNIVEKNTKQYKKTILKSSNKISKLELQQTINKKINDSLIFENTMLKTRLESATHPINLSLEEKKVVVNANDKFVYLVSFYNHAGWHHYNEFIVHQGAVTSDVLSKWKSDDLKEKQRIDKKKKYTTLTKDESTIIFYQRLEKAK